MTTRSSLSTLALSLGLASAPFMFSALSLHAAEKPAYFDETQAISIFAFDRETIPFTENLRIEMRQPERHPANPVVQRGPAGSVDSWAVQFYGSVVRIGDKYCLWYVAAGDDRLDNTVPRSSPWRVAYAESSDGVNWTKPNLGLTEYNGSRENNLVAFDSPHIGILNVKVLHEPEAADAERYKMSAHVWFTKEEQAARYGTLVLFTSADGLRWKPVHNLQPKDAEIIRQEDVALTHTHYEPSGGLYKWQGLYYTSGQNAFPSAQPYHGRVVRSFVSGDFRNWEPASAVGFVRTAQHDLLGRGRSREGEQTHEGISVWNRGNVLLGVYGIWHGAAEWPNVTIDLGFVTSTDGANFREPAHDWAFIKRGEDGQWDQGGLLQGQGFENIGDKTYIYYGAWDPRHVWNTNAPTEAPRRGGVGIATVPRDRLGDLVISKEAIGDNDYQVQKASGSFLTAPIAAGQGKRRFFLNADGLGTEAQLKVELLNLDLSPIAAYAGENAAVISQSGFQTPIVWKDKEEASNLPESLRIRVTYLGKKMEDIRFSALYIRD